MTYRFGLMLGGAMLLGTAAHAQLVFGDNFSYSAANAGLTGAFYLDVQTGNAQQIWTAVSNAGGTSRKVNGLAADENNRVLYSVNAARLWKWDYATVGTNPTFVNGLYRLGADNLTYATGVNGLAVAQGKLYAYTNFNAAAGAAVEDGIYEVNTSIVGAIPNMTPKWSHVDLAYNLEGLDYNSANGLFYATNNSAANAHGIYTVDVFGGGAITKIADFDSFLPNPDGLAVGGGHVWLTGAANGGTELRIAGYNLATGVYDEAFSLSGFPTGTFSSGATWAPNALTPVPEPATLAAVGFGALALLRRRRKS